MRHPKNWLPLYKALQTVLSHRLKALEPDLSKSSDAKRYPFRVKPLETRSGTRVLSRLQWAVVRSQHEKKFRVREFSEQVGHSERLTAKTMAAEFKKVREQLGQAIVKKRVIVEARSPTDRVVPFSAINPEVWLGNSGIVIFETGLIRPVHLLSNTSLAPYLIVFFEPKSLLRFMQATEGNQAAQTARHEVLSEQEVDWFVGHMHMVHSLFNGRASLSQPNWQQFCATLSNKGRKRPLAKKRFEKQIWPKANTRNPETGKLHLSSAGSPTEWKSEAVKIAHAYVAAVNDAQSLPVAVAAKIAGRISL